MNMAEEHIDALRELVNIGVGRAAGMLNQMLSTHVSLQVPQMVVFPFAELQDETAQIFNGDDLSAVQITFKGPFSGAASLVFPPDSAVKLVDMITDEETSAPDLDAIRVGALTEVGNIVLNGVLGSISNVLNQHVTYSIPAYAEGNLVGLLDPWEFAPDDTVLLTQAYFIIQLYQIEGNILVMFTVDSFDALLAAIESRFSD